MKPKSLIILSEAEEDIALGFDWYSEQQQGLGEEFLECVDAMLASIGFLATLSFILWCMRAIAERWCIGFPTRFFMKRQKKQLLSLQYSTVLKTPLNGAVGCLEIFLRAIVPYSF